MRFRVAISGSLQGYPEESSPADHLDTRRLGEYVATNLQATFPQVEVGLYNRDDFPGMGDAYIALRDAVVKWGADVHVTIHQDAGAGRGWHIIYYHGEALMLANELVAAMSRIPSPVRYGGTVQRSNVAVLKRPARTVLVEAGFYTSKEDEAIGVAGWGGPIVAGITNYLARHWGIYPEEKEDEDMPRFERMERPDLPGTHVYGCARLVPTDNIYIHAEGPAHDYELTFYGLEKHGPRKDDRKERVGGWGNRDKNYGGVFTVANLFDWPEVSVIIHSPVELAIEVK